MCGNMRYLRNGARLQTLRGFPPSLTEALPCQRGSHVSARPFKSKRPCVGSGCRYKIVTQRENMIIQRFSCDLMQL